MKHTRFWIDWGFGTASHTLPSLLSYSQSNSGDRSTLCDSKWFLGVDGWWGCRSAKRPAAGGNGTAGVRGQAGKTLAPWPPRAIQVRSSEPRGPLRFPFWGFTAPLGYLGPSKSQLRNSSMSKSNDDHVFRKWEFFISAFLRQEKNRSDEYSVKDRFSYDL